MVNFLTKELNQLKPEKCHYPGVPRNKGSDSGQAVGTPLRELPAPSRFLQTAFTLSRPTPQPSNPVTHHNAASHTVARFPELQSLEFHF